MMLAAEAAIKTMPQAVVCGYGSGSFYKNLIERVIVFC